MTEQPTQHEGRGANRGAGLAWIVPALIVLAAAGAVIGIVVLVPKRDESPPANSPPPVNVKIEHVRASAEVDSFVLVGKAEPDRVVEVSAEVAGRVERIPVTKGRAIKAGEPIIRLNTDLLQAEYDAAKATADFDERESGRITDAAKDGVATDKEVELAQSKAAASKARFEATEARLKRATILAPISGKLDDVVPEQGNYVGAGKVVARIVDMEPARVVVHVPERDVPYLRLGQSEEIIPERDDEEGTEGNKTLSGRITFIGELADPSANTTRVEISVANNPRVLRSGQIVRVRLVRKKFSSAIMIPVDAVIPMGKTMSVYVMDKDGKAERRDNVKTGFIKGDRVRVISGLREGDRLIVDGHRFLSPKQAVKEESTEAAPGAASRPTSAPAAPSKG